jgi:hypothetical protein
MERDQDSVYGAAICPMFVANIDAGLVISSFASKIASRNCGIPQLGGRTERQSGSIYNGDTIIFIRI